VFNLIISAMKKHRFYLSTFVALGIMATLTFSCSETEQFMENETPISIKNETENSKSDPVLTKAETIALTVQTKGTYEISESEALQNLGHFQASVSDNNENSIRTKSVVLKKNQKTGKNMYYEVVFESDRGTGFSILSADERTDDVLCYSEIGAIADTSFNKSLKYCLELVDIYVEEQTKEELDIEALALSAKEKSQMMDTSMIITKSLPPFDPNDPNSPWYWGRTSITTTVSERLKQIPGGWHQGYPFNALLPLIDVDNGIRAYAGCVIIAVTQIMSYHKKPFRDYITTAMWTTILNNINTSVELRNLIRDAFYDMAISYDASGTGSTMTKARSFLNRNGYTTGSKASYSYTNVWNALNDGPTYIEGDRQADTGKVGHAWVVDGARTTTKTSSEIYYCDYNGRIYEIVASSYSITYKEVRYDWGHGNPKTNTWFNDNVFLMNPDRNYNRNVSIISYIR
jgi:hypothetical protein